MLARRATMFMVTEEFWDQAAQENGIRDIAIVDNAIIGGKEPPRGAFRGGFSEFERRSITNQAAV
jgi:hypothetical protein